MVRSLKILIVGFILVIIFAMPAQTRAQSGACPPNTYNLGGPAGTVPSSTDMCTYNLGEVYVQEDTNDRFPCSQHIVIDPRGIGEITSNWGNSLYIVPDSAVYYGETIRIRFMIWDRNYKNFPPPPQIDRTMRIEYYTPEGFLYSYVTPQVNLNYTQVDTWWTSILTYYYSVYLIDQTLPTTEGAGGYIRIVMSTYDISYGDNFASSYGVSSIQIGSADDYFPQYCALPNGDLPTTPEPGPTATGTPPPTWTPNPTTPTATPLTTPAATSTGVAPDSTWTPTPISFATVPAESTPTPWPPARIPTVAWPTAMPTIYAMASTREASSDSLHGVIDNIYDGWATPRAEIRAYSDPNSTIALSTTNEINGFVTRYIHLPVGYLRSVAEIAPNSWRYVTWVFYLAVFVLFVRYSDVVIRVAVFIFELLRRGWELLPFN